MTTNIKMLIEFVTADKTMSFGEAVTTAEDPTDQGCGSARDIVDGQGEIVFLRIASEGLPAQGLHGRIISMVINISRPAHICRPFAVRYSAGWFRYIAFGPLNVPCRFNLLPVFRMSATTCRVLSLTVRTYLIEPSH